MPSAVPAFQSLKLLVFTKLTLKLPLGGKVAISYTPAPAQDPATPETDRTVSCMLREMV